MPEEEVETIEMPPVPPFLNDADLQEFFAFVNTESSFDDLGLQHFIDCKQLFQNIIH